MQTITRKKDTHIFSFAQTPFVYIGKAGFISYTAAGHQGALKIFWLHFSGTTTNLRDQLKKVIKICEVKCFSIAKLVMKLHFRIYTRIPDLTVNSLSVHTLLDLLLTTTVLSDYLLWFLQSCSSFKPHPLLTIHHKLAFRSAFIKSKSLPYICFLSDPFYSDLCHNMEEREVTSISLRL